MLHTRGRVLFWTLAASLLFATSAAAECAWVLWEKTEQMQRREVTSERQDRLAAYETRKDCLSAAKRNAPGAEFVKPHELGKDFGGRIVNVHRDGSVHVLTYDKDDPNAEGQSRWQHYTCWPDTVDPGGPRSR